jgi:ABC-type glycerol-3-phosphate transport system substrate-binding protein
VAVEQLKGVRIRFWHSWTGETAEAIEALEARFNGTNPWSLWVEARQVSSYADIYTAVSDAGSRADGDPLPDVVAGYPEMAEQANSGAANIADLAPYISDPTWGLSAAEQADSIEGLWEANRAGDRKLGIPILPEGRVLFYNNTWAEELGFASPPASTGDFRAQSCAGNQANGEDVTTLNNGTGGWLIDSDPLTVASWITAFQGNLVPGPQGQYSFANPETEAAFTYLRGLAFESCIWTGRLPEPLTYFATRHALLISASTGDIPFQARALARARSRDEWTVLPYPGEAGQRVMLVSGPSLQMVSSDPVRQLAAWLFIRWMNQPENQAELVLASGGLPVRQSTISLLDDYAAQYPQWKASLDLLPEAVNAPNAAAWGLASGILNDAYQQIYLPEPTPEPISDLLRRLEETIQEVMERP